MNKKIDKTKNTVNCRILIQESDIVAGLNCSTLNQQRVFNREPTECSAHTAITGMLNWVK